MATRFENKRAIVTGAAHGIGKAVATKLASEGARVVAADCDMSAAEETAAHIQSLGAQCHAFSVDVSDRQAVTSLVDYTVSELGGIDILVANAGIMDRAPFIEMTDELWDRIININLNRFTSIESFLY